MKIKMFTSFVLLINTITTISGCANTTTTSAVKDTTTALEAVGGGNMLGVAGVVTGAIIDKATGNSPQKTSKEYTDNQTAIIKQYAIITITEDFKSEIKKGDKTDKAFVRKTAQAITQKYTKMVSETGAIPVSRSLMLETGVKESMLPDDDNPIISYKTSTLPLPNTEDKLVEFAARL